MLVCKLELWPHGDRARARELGCVEIANIGGDADYGEYAVKLSKSPEYAKRPGHWRAGAVRKFARRRLGPYDLLLRALAAVIGDRNPDASEAVEARMAELERAP
jgi:hypothetical protein